MPQTEHVWLIATTSFVNRWCGSVNKKQRIYVPANVAEEFVSLGIAKYEGKDTTEVEVIEEKKSNPSQPQDGDGMEGQSASSPAETASTTGSLNTSQEEPTEQVQEPAETASTTGKKGRKKAGK
jgi:hypothetical protein